MNLSHGLHHTGYCSLVSGGASLPLNNKYLPLFHFSEKHALSIAAPQAVVMAAVQAYRPENDKFFRAAIALREIPVRLFDKLRGRTMVSRPAFSLENFTLLERNDDHEIVFGLAGKFWQPDYGQVSVVDAKAFQLFNEPETAKLVLSYYAEKLDDTHTRLTTETRVFCLDNTARRKFAPYWYLIRPVSGLIRRRMLHSVAQMTKKMQ